MKYAAALLTFAIAAPAFAQATSVQSDPEEFRKNICDIRGICDPAEQDKAWAVVTDRRPVGEVGEVKGLVSTLSNLGGSNAGSREASRPANNRPAASAPRPAASRVISNRRRQAAPVIAVVTDEIKGNAPLMVTFASNSARLTKGSMSAVSTFADVLRLDDAMGRSNSKFLIEGHTDSAGDAIFNQSLSKERAEAVVAELVKMGFNAERFLIEGKGEAEPLDGRKGRDPLNRRVIAKAID